MASSPSQDSNGVLKLSILSEGSPIDEAIQVISVSINNSINKIPSARIILMDGDMPEQDFPVSNSDAFAPGSAITIKACGVSVFSTLQAVGFSRFHSQSGCAMRMCRSPP